MVDAGFDGSDRWNIPDDRQLALRGRLDTGWSSYRGNIFSNSKYRNLHESEIGLISSVLEKRDAKQMQEQERIGLLVKKLEQMRKNVLGDGQTTCLICGAKAGFKDSLRICVKCEKMVCSKCSIEGKNSHDLSKSYYCVLCYEERQLWKRSGAWFYNAMPTYRVPEHDDSRKGTIRNNNNSIRQHPSVLRASSLKRNSYDNTLQESLDDLSDDSDIEEAASEKAFVIPVDQASVWQQQIEIDGTTHEHRQNRDQLSQSNSLGSKRSSSSDENEKDISPKNSSGSNVYGSQSSIAAFNDEPTKTLKNDYERQSSNGSSSSSLDHRENKHNLVARHAMRNVRRNTNSSYNSSESYSDIHPNGDINQHGDDASEISSNSTQDIDDMFKSYSSEQSKLPDDESDKTDGLPQVEQKYHGKHGMVEFTLQYDLKTQELLVIIDNCKGLKGPGRGGKLPHPYVKTYLLPEEAKSSKKRTSTIRKSADPVYNETLVYHGISEEDIMTKGLRLSVMDETKIGNDAMIGETCIPLKNLNNRPVQRFRRILDSKSSVESLYLDSKNTSSNPGRIEIALHYLSKQEKLVVGVIRCVGLKALDPNGYSDPYVKCYLLPDPAKKTKQKTVVKKKTLNPEFNQEFSYKIPVNELATKTLHLSVWDYDVGRSNDFIGGITLGINASGDALKHWFETLKTADRRVIKWHTLREDCTIID